MWIKQDRLGGPSKSLNELFPCSSICNDGSEVHRFQYSDCYFMHNQLWIYLYCFWWSDFELVFQQEIVDCNLCNQNFYYFLTEALNMLYVKLVFLQPIVKVPQMLFLTWKLLKSLCCKGLASVMCCKHPSVKIHAFIQCFPDCGYQSCGSLAIEIHEFILNIKSLCTLSRKIFQKFCISLYPSQLTLENFCNF